MKNRRHLDFKKTKTTVRVIVIGACIVFIVAWTGAFFATRQHNKTVDFIALNASATSGVVIKDPDTHSGVHKTNYEFMYGDTKYSGSTYEEYDFAVGNEICIDFNKNNPWQNVYCAENKIIEMDYSVYSIKVVLCLIVLLFFGFLWKYISGDKRFIVESTSRKK